MKISYQWLQDFIDLSSVSAEQVADKITLHTAEVEEIINQADFFDHIVTGKILSITDHPNSDKLKVAQVDTGDHGQRQILFGSALEGVVENIIVPIALPGVVMPNGIEIAEREMAGAISQGMICINSELGFKNPDLEIFSAETELGIPLSQVHPLYADQFIDIDNKSLTHRPDLWGLQGFARDLGAIYEKSYDKSLPTLDHGTFDSQPVQIQTSGCRRFCALTARGITVSPSNLETRLKLENMGTRSISNIVDITNYVMLGYGQPMHAFDADQITGSIIIRQAKLGEKLVALDGVEYELSPEDLVVADETKVLSIAGIMGGQESSVTEQTTNIVFEAATWDPVQIRKTSQRLGLRSESSMRYEKTLDPEACYPAVIRAAHLAKQVCPQAEFGQSITDEYPSPYPTKTIVFDPKLVDRYVGEAVERTYMLDKLQRLGFVIDATSDIWQVTIPSYRATKDVALDVDLAEEIIRLRGFEAIDTQIPNMSIQAGETNLMRNLDWQMRDLWSFLGYQEYYGYSFAKSGEAKALDQKDETYVQIQNPMTTEHETLRQSLLWGIVSGLESELRIHDLVQLFELGRVYEKQTDQYLETPRLAVIKGKMRGSAESLYEALADHLRQLSHQFNLNLQITAENSQHPLLHPAQQGQIIVDDVIIGHIGTLHPQKNPIKNTTFACMEIDMQALLRAKTQAQTTYTALCPYPEGHRDLSVVLSADIEMTQVQKTIQAVSPFIKKCDLFDVYEGDRLEPGLKNLAFHLTFQDTSQTLAETQIDELFSQILGILKTEYSAQLRLDYDQQKTT